MALAYSSLAINKPGMLEATAQQLHSTLDVNHPLNQPFTSKEAAVATAVMAAAAIPLSMRDIANSPLEQRSAKLIARTKGCGSTGNNGQPLKALKMPSKVENISPAEKGSTFFRLNPKVLRRPSVGGDNKKNGKTVHSLQKKYGTCEKGFIGRGATAMICLVHNSGDLSGQKLYAVKRFRKRRKDESEKAYIKKLTSEFCISSALSHPNVVETLDLVLDDHDRWCVVMEYCPGGDLYSVIKTGLMTVEEINCCFKQLISGVEYLHSMGVAHRDIKPENLLFDAKGRLKIADFGVSDVFRMCWEKEAHLSKGLCGSEPYIAPETFTREKYDARKIDIWACGIVYYAMFFHGIPFRIATKSDVYFVNYLECRAKGQDYPSFSKLNPLCRSLMWKILNPDPETRVTALDIVNDAWFREIIACDNGAMGQVHHHTVISPTSANNGSKRKSPSDSRRGLLNSDG